MNFKPLGQTEATKHTQKDQKKEKEHFPKREAQQRRAESKKKRKVKGKSK
jgi:hypothetical protein